jgi:hypothetical protein
MRRFGIGGLLIDILLYGVTERSMAGGVVVSCRNATYIVASGTVLVSTKFRWRETKNSN